MRKFLTLKNKIYFLSLFSAVFLVAIVISGYSNLNHLLKYFDDFSATSSFAKKNIRLAKDVEELRGSVQKFSYTGLKDEATYAKSLYAKIQENIKQSQPLSNLSIDENFKQMQVHLEKYMKVFEELERQVLAKKKLGINKRVLSNKMEKHLKRYLELPHAKTEINYHLTLLISLHELERDILHFFDTLDNKYIKIIKKGHKDILKQLAKLKTDEVDQESITDLDEIIDTFKTYSKVNTKEIQQTRGYLFLVNVVMAAEAYEVLYQANKVSDTSESILNKIDIDLKTKIESSINTLAVTGLFSLLLMLIISLVIIRSIVKPLSSLTHSFEELANGNSDIEIEPYKVKDEIGGLTQAARVFREKNEETQALLNYSEELSKSLKLSEERFSLALEGAKDGLWDWNLITDEVFYSDTWKNMFGYSGDNVQNTLENWKDKIHPDDVQAVMKTLKNYLKDGTKAYESEMRIRCSDGQYKHILARGKAITDNDGYIIRLIGLHIDITEQKKLEISLISAKIDADNANRSKSDFLANMSHEIRTPLNGILGLTDLALKTQLDTKQRDYLSKSKTSSQALLRVINDILDYSKIEAGKLDLEMRPFDLKELINNIMDLFQYQADYKGISLLVDNTIDFSEYRLVGDSLRLTQILTNLVGNAIKFTDHGNVLILIRSLNEDDTSQEVEFTVRDSGIGMNKEVQENLFKEFTQADTSITRKYGGTGLGLSISKQLVKLMQGEIWIESVEGEGSSFIFKLCF